MFVLMGLFLPCLRWLLAPLQAMHVPVAVRAPRVTFIGMRQTPPHQAPIHVPRPHLLS